MPQDRQKRKDKTETALRQSLERTGASNLSWEASSTSSKSQKATSKLKTLAGRQVRELGRKRDHQQKSQYQKELTWYQKVIHQQRFDQNKVDAIHGLHGQRQGSSNR